MKQTSECYATKWESNERGSTDLMNTIFYILFYAGSDRRTSAFVEIEAVVNHNNLFYIGCN